MSSLIRYCRAAFVTLAFVLPAAQVAQAEGPAMRIRGEVVKLEGDMLQVKDRQGVAHTVKLATNFRVTEIRKAELKEIANGAYIGVTAMPAKDGALAAVAIHIFPPQAKGTAEGHHKWDLKPEATMTNATVDGEVTAKGSESTLKVKYKDGEKTVIVTPETAIVAMGAGKPDQLVPGAKIMIFGATRNADGSLNAASVAVGKDGLTPPM